MSVYLGYDTITKQYLKDLVSTEEKTHVTEWTSYYSNVNTAYVWPHGMNNFPCSVRNDDIKEGTHITVKTLSFDDVTTAKLNTTSLYVRGRFVKSDNTVVLKDLFSIDLSSKFSAMMLRDWSTSTSVPCYSVSEKVDVSDEKGSVLFQFGVKFRKNLGVGITPELAVVYAIS